MGREDGGIRGGQVIGASARRRGGSGDMAIDERKRRAIEEAGVLRARVQLLEIDLAYAHLILSVVEECVQTGLGGFPQSDMVRLRNYVVDATLEIWVHGTRKPVGYARLARSIMRDAIKAQAAEDEEGE